MRAIRTVPCLLLIAGLAFSAAAEEALPFPPDAQATVVFTPVRKATLSAEVGARVVRVAGEIGHTFAEGDVLVELDSTFHAKQLQKSLALLALARASLAAAEELHKKEINLREANADLDYARAQLASFNTLVAKEVHLRKAQAAVELTRATLDTTRKLHEDGTASRENLATATRDLIVSEANLELVMAEQTSELARLKRGVAAGHMALERVKATRAPALENARKDFNVAEANLAIAQEELSACRLLAPFPGHLDAMHTQEHELVQRGQKLIDIVTDRVLRARFLAPSMLHSRVKVGSKVAIDVDEIKLRVIGTISNISPTVDPASESFEIYVKVDNAQRLLRSGWRGRVRLADLLATSEAE